MSQNSADTKKKLGLLACIGTGIGAIIGSGIFGALPEAINLVGSAMIPALILAALYTCIKYLSFLAFLSPSSLLQKQVLSFCRLFRPPHAERLLVPLP